MDYTARRSNFRGTSPNFFMKDEGVGTKVEFVIQNQ